MSIRIRAATTGKWDVHLGYLGFCLVTSKHHYIVKYQLIIYHLHPLFHGQSVSEEITTMLVPRAAKSPFTVNVRS
jgi:hypothetical protein